MIAEILAKFARSIFDKMTSEDTLLRDRIILLEHRIELLESQNTQQPDQNTIGSDPIPSANTTTANFTTPGVYINEVNAFHNDPMPTPGDSISHVIYVESSNTVYVHTVNGNVHEYSGDYFGIIQGSQGQYTLDVPNLGIYQLYITKPNSTMEI